jgi:hypothetical protein
MGVICLTSRPRTARGRVAVLGALFLMVFCAQLVLAATAGAGPLTGGFSPTVINGGADLNGDGAVTGRDDANEFYGSTSIIDGKLDCDAWGATANQGDAGDLAITGADDCSLVGYDGTVFGVTINVDNACSIGLTEGSPPSSTPLIRIAPTSAPRTSPGLPSVAGWTRTAARRSPATTAISG